MFSKLRSVYKKIYAYRQHHTHLLHQQFRLLNDIRDIVLASKIETSQHTHINPLNRFGKKCFSQGDEDGVTLEIIKRMKIDDGVFAEFGVGDGTENNTLILRALGWRGFWVGGEELILNINHHAHFTYLKSWITKQNILTLTREGLETIRADELDVISLDLDGNDYYFVEQFLSAKVHPKLFIVEYNAKFPPPIKWKIDYDDTHQWQGDDYFGASLCSFIDMFEKFGYKLVCCNASTGCNAFFVRHDYHDLFSDVPTDIEQLYVSPRYMLLNTYGHSPAKKTLERIMNMNRALA